MYSSEKSNKIDLNQFQKSNFDSSTLDIFLLLGHFAIYFSTGLGPWLYFQMIMIQILCYTAWWEVYYPINYYFLPVLFHLYSITNMSCLNVVISANSSVIMSVRRCRSPPEYLLKSCSIVGFVSLSINPCFHSTLIPVFINYETFRFFSSKFVRCTKGILEVLEGYFTAGHGDNFCKFLQISILEITHRFLWCSNAWVIFPFLWLTCPIISAFSWPQNALRNNGEPGVPYETKKKKKKAFRFSWSANGHLLEEHTRWLAL